MNEFLKALKEERARIEPIAQGEELPPLREQLADAKAALQVFRDRGDEERMGHSEPLSREFSRLRNACLGPGDRIYVLEREQRDAQRRLREIDAVLNADKNLATARAAWASGAAELAQLNARAVQLDTIIASLRGEIDELTAKQQRALADYGEAEMASRLAGKTTAPPKSLGSAEVELSSRNAALAATEAARAKVKTSIDALLQASDGVRTRLRNALARKAELEYYDVLPSFLPVIARLIALNSWIGGGDRNSFTVRCDEQLVKAAAAEVDAEIAGTATVSEAA
jgi:chromosome segregation ATPase